MSMRIQFYIMSVLKELVALWKLISVKGYKGYILLFDLCRLRLHFLLRFHFAHLPVLLRFHFAHLHVILCVGFARSGKVDIKDLNFASKGI